MHKFLSERAAELARLTLTIRSGRGRAEAPADPGRGPIPPNLRPGLLGTAAPVLMGEPPGRSAKCPSKKSLRPHRRGLKRFKPILEAAKSRDVNESDASMIVTDVLDEVFGFDKDAEVTREYAIRGTFCDLATKIEGKLQTLIEVKSIGLDLRENHIKQAVDYAANEGVEWVILTDGQHWKVFSASFSKPISADLVLAASSKSRSAGLRSTKAVQASLAPLATRAGASP